MVKKKTGEDRICVDFQKLNAKAVKDRFPIPNIDDCIQRLVKKRYFSTFDLVSGYYQIPVEEHSRKYTSFVTTEGQYEFLRMPFGWVNASSVFQRMMNQIMKEMNNRIVPYIDDVILASDSVEENLELIREFLEKLREYGLTLKLSKCKFLLTKVEFLGHEISGNGIRPSLEKIVVVQNFPKLTNVHEIRQFIGLASYFRKFVPKFALIAEPLTRLTRKNVKFEWGPEQEQSFETIKNILCHRNVLTIFDNARTHEVHTDASISGLAGVLMQLEDNELHPVAYYSRQTSDLERKYHSYELEALAVVESLDRFRHFLLGKHFRVVTDCSFLKATANKKDIIPRIARWWLRLTEYDFEVFHRAGAKMAHVDALSRNAYFPPSSILPASLDVFHVEDEDRNWLEILQENDEDVIQIKENIKSPKYSSNFVVKDNRLYRKVNDEFLFYVPKGIRGRVVKSCHDDMGHFALERSLSALRSLYW